MIRFESIVKFLTNRYVSVFSEITIIIAPAYFLFIKKGLNLSLSNGLRLIFQHNVVEFIIWVLYVGIALAIFIKIIIFVCEKFNFMSREVIVQDGIKELCLRLNKEIEGHIDEGQSLDKKAWLKSLTRNHEFDRNIALIISQMTEHLANSLKIKKKRKDIFVSLYFVKDFHAGNRLSEFDSKNERFIDTHHTTKVLTYLTHWDPSSSHKYSNAIDIGDDRFKEYECIKAYKEGKYIHVKADSKDYYCSPNNPRAKNTQNFVCFFITINNTVVGLLNIEFHNNKVFNSEQAIMDYIESDLMPYKFMIQYQFLKKRFFHLL